MTTADVVHACSANPTRAAASGVDSVATSGIVAFFACRRIAWACSVDEVRGKGRGDLGGRFRQRLQLCEDEAERAVRVEPVPVDVPLRRLRTDEPDMRHEPPANEVRLLPGDGEGGLTELGRRAFEIDDERDAIVIGCDRQRVRAARPHDAAEHRCVQLDRRPLHRAFSERVPAMAPGGACSSGDIPSGSGSGS